MNPQSQNLSQSILQTQGLAKSFLGLQALQDFSIDIRANEILGLIGPNGAGKTTCFNLLTGFLIPTAGQIYFKGEAITGRSPAQIARAGLARTFQNIRVFNTLSVLENVMAAAQLRTRFSLGELLLSAPGFRRKEDQVTARAFELLTLLGLSEYADRPAASLPYAYQRRLEIARALATEPQLLLLDEPAAGMNPAESHSLHQLILDLRIRFQLTVLLVEHDMRLVMNLCERIIVLNYGKIIAEGRPEVVRANPQVIAAYLGEDHSQTEVISA
ncbi:MAG TPA: ABC transporter ATP-binding protein [Anaerolineales bacterium]|nr:ABC transporter ATP-binding protein [Anaerolineales bacterium]